MNVRFPRLLLLFPSWLAFVLYLPALSHGLVWDDLYFLTDQPYLRDPGLWWGQLRQPLFVSGNYFRPLPLLTFVAEARLGVMNPFVFHLVNVLLHALNTGLVVALARRLGCGAMAACGAGLLFALHPALVESVCWVSDRFDLLMAVFLFAALWTGDRIRHGAVRGLAVGSLFFLALLSKETAIILLALLPLFQMAAWRASGQPLRTMDLRLWLRRAWPAWVGLLPALLVYLILRESALAGLYQADAQMVAGNVLQHLLLVGKTLGLYLSLLVWPFGRISPVHPAPTPVMPGDVAAWLGLAATVLLTLMLIWQRRRPVPVLLGLMGLVALAPVSNLVPLTIGDNLVQDRYLLLPVAFAALALASLWQPGRMPRRWGVAWMSWCVACAFSVALAIPHWAGNLTLWRWAYAQAPESHVAQENLLGVLANAGLDEEALAVGAPMLARRPEQPALMHNMALAEMRLGRLAAAESRVRAVLSRLSGDSPKVRMDRSEAWNLLGYILMGEQRRDEAERALRESVTLSPYLSRPHFNLALLYFQQGRDVEAEREMAFVRRYDTPQMAAVHEARLRELRATLAARITPRDPQK